MKKIIIAVVAIAVGFVQANAMSHTRAHAEALFLTDKMAYELNLTNAQYDAVYEINYDYFVSLVGTTDILGIFWNRRERELEWVLTDWQYRTYLASTYFYKPVVIHNNAFRLAIYDRYAHNRYYKPVRKIHKTYHGGRDYKAPGHNLAHNPGPAPAPGNVKPNNGGNHNKPGNVKPNNGGNHNKPGNVKPNNGGTTNKPGNVKPNNGGNNKPANAAPKTGSTTRSARSTGNAGATAAPRASKNAPAAATSSNAMRARGASNNGRR